MMNGELGVLVLGSIYAVAEQATPTLGTVAPLLRATLHLR